MRSLDVEVTLAVNHERADRSTVLHDGDELALILPVSGGADAPRIHARVSGEVGLQLDRLARSVVRPGAGRSSFQGVTREVERLGRSRGLR